MLVYWYIERGLMLRFFALVWSSMIQSCYILMFFSRSFPRAVVICSEGFFRLSRRTHCSDFIKSPLCSINSPTSQRSSSTSGSKYSETLKEGLWVVSGSRWFTFRSRKKFLPMSWSVQKAWLITVLSRIGVSDNPFLYTDVSINSSHESLVLSF